MYLSVGLALAILMRTVLSEQALHTAWRLREVVGIEGLLYLAMFQPPLLPILLVAAAIASVAQLRHVPRQTPPPTPGEALRSRFAELIGALLLACLAAAIIKVFAPSMPENLIMRTALALAASLLVGGSSGTSAIPAVAITVHAGGLVPASAWITGAAVRVIFSNTRDLRRQVTVAAV